MPIIRYDRTHVYQPPSALLDRFAVFSVTSRTGVHTSAGDIISHPRLASLPLSVLRLTEPNGPKTDPGATRQVITRSGVELWITPGPNTLCITVIEEPEFPGLLGSGAFGSCSGSLTQAEADGTGVGSSGNPGGPPELYEVVPIGKTITIRTRGGSRTTFYPPDGIYAGPNGPPRP